MRLLRQAVAQGGVIEISRPRARRGRSDAAPALKLVSPPPDPQLPILPEGLSAGDVWASSGAASVHPGPAL